MYTQQAQVRVRYAETDQMGVVYYGNYAQYFEIGRVEALRNLGTTYRQMEEEGIMLPVITLQCKYIRPAKYDDLLTIKTTIAKIPDTRIQFDHEIFNEAGTLLVKGFVELVFVNAKTMRPCAAPHGFVALFEKYF